MYNVTKQPNDKDIFCQIEWIIRTHLNIMTILYLQYIDIELQLVNEALYIIPTVNENWGEPGYFFRTLVWSLTLNKGMGGGLLGGKGLGPYWGTGTCEVTEDSRRFPKDKSAKEIVQIFLKT